MSYTILCDIDNTINNMANVLLSMLNEKYNTQYKYEELTDYEWLNRTFTNPFSLTELPEFWDKVLIDHNAIKFLEQSVKEGIKVYLVTASHFNDSLGYKIRRTLAVFNPEYINAQNIIIARDKNAICGDILIDDHIDNLNSFDGEKVCFKQPWNHTWEGHTLNFWPNIKLLSNNSE